MSVSVAAPAAVLRPQSKPATEVARRLLVVGTGRRAAALIRTLQGNGIGNVIACVDRRPQANVPAAMPELPVFIDSGDLTTIILEHAIDEVFVALPLRSCFDDYQRAQAVGRELAVPVHFDFDWAEAARFVRTSDTALLTCHEHASSHPLARGAKRLFDVAAAAALIVLTSPLLLASALLVKLSSPGPVLFRQPRVGRHRRVFEMLKFRTMVADAEALRATVEQLNEAKGIMFKLSRDPRVTWIGRWLRVTSIDELPQLFNVLRGEMSLVGPRPIPTWVFDQATEPPFHRRFAVMPGMTGLWQVNGREQHYTLMARYDLAYVDTWSFWLDIRILFRTIPVVVRGRGAR